MRQYILKVLIAIISIYILFQVTIGYRIDFYSSKIESLTSQHKRIEFKKKILNEIKKGTEKDNLFTKEERIILSNFIKKIALELNIN